MNDAGDGQALSGNWTETQGGLTQTRTGAPVGAISQPSFTTTTQITDSYESYTVSTDLNGLNSGYNFAGAYVERWNWVGSPLGTDDFESYTPGVSLNSLNGGLSYDYGAWAGAYVDRSNLFGPIQDTFETYTVGANLDGLNDGTSFGTSTLWSGAYVSR